MKSPLGVWLRARVEAESAGERVRCCGDIQGLERWVVLGTLGAGTCCLLLVPAASHPTMGSCLILPVHTSSSPGHALFLSPSLCNALQMLMRAFRLQHQ